VGFCIPAVGRSNFWWIAIRKAALVVTALLSLFCAGNPALAEKRVALVIGNSAYQNAPEMPNPASDAAAMSDPVESRSFAGPGGARRVGLGNQPQPAQQPKAGPRLDRTALFAKCESIVPRSGDDNIARVRKIDYCVANGGKY
jgi:hypothetical protein